MESVTIYLIIFHQDFPTVYTVLPQLFFCGLSSADFYEELIHTEILYKIIAWQTDNSTQTKLSKLIQANALEAELHCCNEKNILQCIDAETVLIITDYQFWYSNNPLTQLSVFSTVTSAPVIAWTATVNRHIMSAVFSSYKVLFIRNSSSENVMLETLKKYCNQRISITGM
jgi:hypothetical protein